MFAHALALLGFMGDESSEDDFLGECIAAYRAASATAAETTDEWWSDLLGPGSARGSAHSGLPDVAPPPALRSPSPVWRSAGSHQRSPPPVWRSFRPSSRISTAGLAVYAHEDGGDAVEVVVAEVAVGAHEDGGDAVVAGVPEGAHEDSGGAVEAVVAGVPAGAHEDGGGAVEAVVAGVPVGARVAPDFAWPVPPAHLLVPGYGEVVKAIRPVANMDDAIAHVKARIGAWIHSSADMFIYKVGITWRPWHRWINEEYGYAGEDYHFLETCVAGTAKGIKRLERRLVDELMGHDWRCQNAARGGGGVSDNDSSRYFLYVAYKDVLPGQRNELVARHNKHRRLD